MVAGSQAWEDDWIQRRAPVPPVCPPANRFPKLRLSFLICKVELTPPTYLQGRMGKCQAISIVPITQEVLIKRFLCVLMKTVQKFDSFFNSA